MIIEDFYFQKLKLVKSCGEFTCDGSHNPDTPCPGYESVHAPTIYAVDGILIVTKPDFMMEIPIRFRSRKIAGLLVHEELLDGGTLARDQEIDDFEFIVSVDALLEEYRKHKSQWYLTAWYKPACKG
jgi:hypothetical protein